MKKWRDISKSRLKKWHDISKSRLKKWHIIPDWLIKMQILRRKIEKGLNDWKRKSDHLPLVVKGCRQCGKTFSVLKFAREHYRHVVYVNFVDDEDAVIAFKHFRKVDDLIMGITSEEMLDMYPLDFEEFMWANGVPDEAIARMRNCLDKVEAVPEVLHERFRKLLLQYTIVGGMPRVVNEFLQTHDMNSVVRQQRAIIDEYKDDMMKYAENIYKPRLREAFESIPRQLSKDNKKFQYSVIKKGAKAAHYIDALQWVEDAGIICRCRNLHITELPLDGNAINDHFKVYMVDTGLFMSMLEDGTQFKVLQGNLMSYKGAIFENLIADIFSKMNRKLYYFSKSSGLEVDFVIRYKGEATLVEVKSSTGNVKSTKTILKHPEKYHVTKAIKLGNYNVGISGGILTLPLYMAFLLQEP